MEFVGIFWDYNPKKCRVNPPEVKKFKKFFSHLIRVRLNRECFSSIKRRSHETLDDACERIYLATFVYKIRKDFLVKRKCSFKRQYVNGVFSW